MHERAVEIRTADGISDGFIFEHEGEPRPGVIHLTDIGGVRPAQHVMCRKLAQAGYTVLMPNIFYRNAKPPVIAFPLQGEDVQKHIQELKGPLTPDAINLDASAYVDFLAAQPTVSDAPFGVVGYCFSGAMALRIAAARPDKVAAAASFHAARLATEEADSPHLLLPKIKAQLYFGHAVQDRSMPQEMIDHLDEALENWAGRYESEVYEGAFHSWTAPDSPVFNEAATERAFAKLTDLFDSTLKKDAFRH